MSNSQQLVRASYRKLYRARKNLFGADREAMNKSRLAVQEQYKKTTHIKSHEHLQGLLGVAEETCHLLRTGFVQGSLNETTGHYEVKLKDHQDTHASVQPVTPKIVEELEKQREPVQVTKTTST